MSTNVFFSKTTTYQMIICLKIYGIKENIHYDNQLNVCYECTE